MVFAGAHPAALARHLFCSGVNPRHAHVPSRLPPRVFLFSGMMSWEDDERWRRLALGFKGINVFLSQVLPCASFGLYLSRPYAQPVSLSVRGASQFVFITRLTYGVSYLKSSPRVRLPLDHSTNCSMSRAMALFPGVHVRDLHRAGSLSTTVSATRVTRPVLLSYVSSIVGGQLYTGMPGFLDVSVGVILRATGWIFQQVMMPDAARGREMDRSRRLD